MKHLRELLKPSLTFASNCTLSIGNSVYFFLQKSPRECLNEEKIMEMWLPWRSFLCTRDFLCLEEKTTRGLFFCNDEWLICVFSLLPNLPISWLNNFKSQFVTRINFNQSPIASDQKKNNSHSEKPLRKMLRKCFWLTTSLTKKKLLNKLHNHVSAILWFYN